MRTFLQVVAGSIILLMACDENSDFDNPFDPASPKYIPPITGDRCLNRFLRRIKTELSI